MSESKQLCRHCGKLKPSNIFPKKLKKCRPCLNAIQTQQKKKRESLTEAEIVADQQKAHPNGEKFCIRCKSKHALDAFPRDKCRVDGLYSMCIEPPLEILQSIWKRLYPCGKKRCLKCKKEVSLIFFTTQNKKRDGLRNHCNSCMKDLRNEERIAQKKRYQERERKSKTCTTCKKEKSLEHFVLNKLQADGWNKNCKVCSYHEERVQLYLRKEFLISSLGKECKQCKNTCIETFHAAHIDSKQKKRSKHGTTKTPCQLSMKDLEKEVKILRWLCANCHRIETAQRWVDIKEPHPDLRNKQECRDHEKLRRGMCNRCNLTVNNNNLCVFDFDHLNPEGKVCSISHLVHSSCSLDTLKQEMVKCQSLCANCHLIVTKERFQANKTERILILKTSVVASVRELVNAPDFVHDTARFYVTVQDGGLLNVRKRKREQTIGKVTMKESLLQSAKHQKT